MHCDTQGLVEKRGKNRVLYRLLTTNVPWEEVSKGQSSWMGSPHEAPPKKRLNKGRVPSPIASMYGTFTYIYHQNQLSVSKYSIHGLYGSYIICKKTESGWVILLMPVIFDYMFVCSTAHLFSNPTWNSYSYNFMVQLDPLDLWPATNWGYFCPSDPVNSGIYGRLQLEKRWTSR